MEHCTGIAEVMGSNPVQAGIYVQAFFKYMNMVYSLQVILPFHFQTITHKTDGTVTEAAIDFATYGTKPSGDRSGAYLFLPDGPAEVRKILSISVLLTF